jgi:hypothetical protein
LRIDLGNVAYRSPNLFELSFLLIVIVDPLDQGGLRPSEVLVQETHKGIDVVFEELRKVLAVEVIKYFEQKV